MNQNPLPDPRDPAFLNAVAKARSRIARVPLNDEDLTLLVVEEISRTHTREEKRYDA